MNKSTIKISKSFYGQEARKIKNPLLVLKDISKFFVDQELFSDVNLMLKTNDRVSIVGPNGIGKSTLLKIIIGLEKPNKGIIDRNKNLKIGFLPQETHWDSLKNTLLQEILSVINAEKLGDDIYRRKGLAKRLLEDFGLPEKSWSRTVMTLSGGERTKLALVKLLISGPNLLVLDEPTNHLDLETIEWLEQFLSNWKGAVICVSHDRYFLDKICNGTFELARQGLEKYYCPYSEYLIEKTKRFEKKEIRYKQQQKYLKEQQVFIDRFRAKATKAKGVKSRIKQLEKVERLESQKTAQNIKVSFDVGEKTCTKVLKINDLTVGRKESSLFRISDRMEVIWGDKIGIIGKNGIGKSTLLKVILGQEDKIKFGQGIQIGYYAQAHEELNPEKTILEEITSKTTANEEKARNVLGRLLFTNDEVLKKIECLSGGERARVALAELILQKSNLLLLDEPTNHLDLPSKEVIANVLKDFNGTILLVSHDRYILNKICSAIWEIKDGELKKYLGNYDDYRYHLRDNS